MSRRQDANIKKRPVKSILIKTLRVFVGIITSALLSIGFSILYFFAITSLFPFPENGFAVGIYLLEGVMIPIAFFMVLGISTGCIIAVFQNLIQSRKNLVLANSLIWFISLFFIRQYYYPISNGSDGFLFVVALSILCLVEIILVNSFTNWLLKRMHKTST